MSTESNTTLTTPPLSAMLFELTDVLKQNIANLALKGVLIANDDVIASRNEICSTCEFLIKDYVRCSKCGCYMKIKTRLDVSKCPIGKW